MNKPVTETRSAVAKRATTIMKKSESGSTPVDKLYEPRVVARMFARAVYFWLNRA